MADGTLLGRVGSQAPYQHFGAALCLAALGAQTLFNKMLKCAVIKSSTGMPAIPTGSGAVITQRRPCGGEIIRGGGQPLMTSAIFLSDGFTINSLPGTIAKSYGLSEGTFRAVLLGMGSIARALVGSKW